MEMLNTLPAIVLSIRVTTESQSFWEAPTAPSNTPQLKTRSRRLTYTSTLYQAGNYDAAKALADSLTALPAAQDIAVDLLDREERAYSVTVTIKTEGAWSAWS